MSTSKRVTPRVGTRFRPERVLALYFCRFAATVGLAFTAGAAQAAGMPMEKTRAPTPENQRAPTAIEEAALRQRMIEQETNTRSNEASASAARERLDMQALGLSPDDPVALDAYRTEIQRSPDAVTAAGDFVLNTSWGNGGLAGERYAGSNSGTYLGIKAAALSNGDVVVVGQVQFSSTASRQLGITKRRADGSRAVWTGADPQYSQYGGQYIVYPNTNTSVPPVWRVVDVKVRNDKIYVLVTGQLSSPSTYAPNILCFNADGSGCGYWFAYMNPSSFTNDAVAMDIYGGYLAVLGRNSLGTSGGFWVAVFPINAGGGLDTAGGANFPAPNGFDRSEPADIAFRRSLLLPLNGAPDYYVLFTKKYSADSSDVDYDPCLLAVRGSNNTPDTTFASGGVRCKPFDESGSGKTDKAIALTTNAWGGISDSHQGVQVLVNVARSVDSGTGIWELLDRADHPRFGALGGAAGSHARGEGRVVFGGCGPSSDGEGCFTAALHAAASHSGNDFLNFGNDMVVAGFRNGTSIVGGTTRYNSSLIARVNGDSGELTQFSTFASGYSEGWFYSLVARNDHEMIGIGAAIDNTVATSTARTQIMTGLTNLDDVIFRNGFD